MRQGLVRLAAGVLALSPAMAGAATQCFTKAEQDAAVVRQLQMEMMTVALACRAYTNLGTMDHYNRFVEKHRPQLQSSMKVVQAHFKRHFGADSAVSRQEKYDTVLANAASNRNMEINGDVFCPRIVKVLTSAMAAEPGTLLAYATANLPPGEEMPLCGRPAAPAVRTAAVQPAAAASTSRPAAAPSAPAPIAVAPAVAVRATPAPAPVVQPPRPTQPVAAPQPVAPAPSVQPAAFASPAPPPPPSLIFGTPAPAAAPTPVATPANLPAPPTPRPQVRARPR